MHPIRKKGRGGGSGKAVAPHPDELIGVSPTSEEGLKGLPGLRTRKPVETTNSKSPLEASYGSSNLAATVLRSLQRDREERRSSVSTRKVAEDSGDESTPKVVEGGEKLLPEVPQKKPVRSVSRGKESGKKEEKPVVPRSDEKRNPRRSVSAQPMRECRHREPFDCSAKIGPSMGMAKALLKSSTKVQVAVETKKPEVLTKKKEEKGDELKQVVDSVKPSGKPSGEPSGFSNALHERLALLEEKVSLLATELRDTKQILHASNPLNNQVLTDIQSKITNIEKALVSRHETRISVSGAENLDSERRKSIITSTQKAVDEKLVTVLKDKPALHKKLLESRAALQQKIVENRLLLRNKIASLDGTEVVSTEGEVITAEFLASLKQSQALNNGMQKTDVELVKSALVSAAVPAKFVDMESLSPKGIRKCPPVVSAEKKRRFIDCGDVEIGTLRTSGSYKSANTSASDVVLESLQCDEALEDEDVKENAAPVGGYEVPVDDTEPELCEIGAKAAMAGWFVYEAEGLLLAHEDGSCSFYDVANMEEKTKFKGPEGLAPATWQDCWLIRAAGTDGRPCKYVVAASAGTAVDPAFCSWNFYEKTIAAYHSESPSWPTTPSTVHSSKSSPVGGQVKNELDFPLWWYRPCGSLMASGGSGMKTVSLYDIRDGEFVMRWNSDRCMATMGYNSPVHWRSRSSVLVAEDEGITVWDVSNPEAQCVNNVNLPGKTIQALHVHNSDGECNGGVRQRISSNDTGGLDGVFATQDSVNVLDVRVSSGLGLQIPALGRNVHSIFAHGDSIFAGFTDSNNQCAVQQWSIRQGQAMQLYTIPYSASSHHLHTEILQVWGNSNHVMAVNGNGLFVFDEATGTPRAVIGSDDLYCPSFDYSGSKVLLISRDRPASWQYWPISPTWTV